MRPATKRRTPSLRKEGKVEFDIRHSKLDNVAVSRILNIGVSVPPHEISQLSLRDLARGHFQTGIGEIGRLISVFDNVQVKHRHFCVPVEWFGEPHTFEERNDLYNRWAEDLGSQAIQNCLEPLGVDPSRVDHLLFVSTSGMSTPSVDARLINRLGFDRHVCRTPIFGLGCAGGAAGLSRCHQLSKADPQALVLLVAVEISSLTFQADDFSKSNLVAAALFADGAAAVLVGGNGTDLPGPEIMDTQSTLWPDTLDVMGWDFSSRGLSVIFSKSIPFLLRKFVRENVDGFLTRSSQTVASMSHFAIHPGGARILESMSESLQISEDHLALSRRVLEEYGNMSSPTVLFILKRLLENGGPSAGDHGLAAAFGPGFSSELLLLKW